MNSCSPGPASSTRFRALLAKGTVDLFMMGKQDLKILKKVNKSLSPSCLLKNDKAEM